MTRLSGAARSVASNAALAITRRRFGHPAPQRIRAPSVRCSRLRSYWPLSVADYAAPARSGCEVLVDDTPVRLLPEHRIGPVGSPLVLDARAIPSQWKAIASAVWAALARPAPSEARRRSSMRGNCGSTNSVR